MSGSLLVLKERNVIHPNKPFAVIIWGDAHGDATEEVKEDDIDKKHKPSVFYSYGWVLRSNPTGVSLAAEWCPEDKSYRATMFVPRPMIIEERELRLSKAYKKATSAPQSDERN
jgi:hypothetical protein